MEHRNYIVYKMSKKIQDKIPGHYIYAKNMDITTNGWQRQRTIGNRKETGPNQPRGLTGIHSTVHLFIQQK